MRRFAAFIRQNGGTALWPVVVISAAAGLCSALLIALVGSVFANLQAGVPLWPVAGIVLLVLSLTALEYLAKRRLLQSSERLAHRLRMDFVRWRMAQPLAATEARGPTSMIATFSEDIRRLSLAMEYVPELGISLAAIAGGAIYLSWVSWPIMAFAVVAVLPAAWVFLRIQQRVRQALVEMLSARDLSNDFFKTSINGIKELKLAPGKLNSILDGYLAPASETLSNASQRLALMYAAGTLWTQFCYFGAIVVVLALVSIGGLGPDVVAPYVLVALFLRSYIYRFMSALPHWTAAGAVLDRLDAEGFRFESSVAQTKQQPLRETDTGPALHREFDLVVDEVSYRYTSERDTSLFTAGPFNLRLSKPEILFVTGQNGVGKSTFMKTLCGLYPARTGQLSLNGQAITADNLSWYRSHFSAVFTVPHVFPEIPLEWPTAPEQRQLFEHYLSLLQLDGKISPERQSRIPELSHGQTKRLALLHALMDDRPVILFDEWAENQDPAYKRLFYYDILPRLRDSGRIIVAITHESHYFDAADRVYELRSNAEA